MESLIYKIKQFIRRLLGKDKREFEENKAAVLAAATEELARRGQKKEEKPIELYPYQKDMIAEAVKFFRQREEEEKKLRKWRRYAEHAKKWRIRKKYKKKIQEYYKNKPRQGSGMLIRGGNWHNSPYKGNWPEQHRATLGGSPWRTPALGINRHIPYISIHHPAGLFTSSEEEEKTHD